MFGLKYCIIPIYSSMYKMLEITSSKYMIVKNTGNVNVDKDVTDSYSTHVNYYKMLQDYKVVIDNNIIEKPEIYTATRPCLMEVAIKSHIFDFFFASIFGIWLHIKFFITNRTMFGLKYCIIPIYSSMYKMLEITSSKYMIVKNTGNVNVDKDVTDSYSTHVNYYKMLQDYKVVIDNNIIEFASIFGI
ncbi:hypothetical protein ACJX0J_015650, partial [Zea mays]